MCPLMFIEWEEKGCGGRTILLGTVGNWEYFSSRTPPAWARAGPGRLNKPLFDLRIITTAMFTELLAAR